MSPSSFDDVELAAVMRRAGIVRKPGAAAAHLAEIAPLLAAEGIDLSSFGGDISQLNAALARANERHNLTLFSPTGAHLDGAISVLRLFTQARAEGALDRAQYILMSIGPDATVDRPAISHVIGVGLGRLDEWSRQSEVKRIVANAKPQPWNVEAGKAARRILELAARSRSFASLDSLHRRFGGLAILEGAAIAVAAVVRAYAARKKLGIVEACDVLLPGEDNLGTSDELRPEDRRALDEFDIWLEGEAFVDEDADVLVDTLTVVFRIARANGIDPQDPNRMDDLLAALAETAAELADDEDDEEAVLDLLHRAVDEYAHFQLDFGESFEWEEAHSLIEDVLVGDNNPLLGLLDALASGEAAEAATRRAALAELPIVSAVPELLAWLGKGRPASPSGTAKRADIETVAALLGIDAVGVKSKPKSPAGDAQPHLHLDDVPSPPKTRAVMSMSEIPELMAWWDALESIDVIDAASGRLRPGPEADAWLSGEGPPLEAMEILLANYVATFIMHDVTSLQRSGGSVGWDRRVAVVLTERLIEAIADPDVETGLAATAPADLFAGRVQILLAQLAAQGIVHLDPDGSIEVPLGLRLTVLRGVIAASMFIDVDEE